MTATSHHHSTVQYLNPTVAALRSKRDALNEQLRTLPADSPRQERIMRRIDHLSARLASTPIAGPVQYVCDVDGCEVFPFATQAELDEHIASGEHVHGPFVTATTARIEERPERPTGNGPGHGPSTPAPSNGNAATDKQLAFLRSLAADRGQTETVEAAIAAGLDKRAASAIIDALKSAPRPTTPRPERHDPPEGFHQVDGTIYRVQRSKSGNLYAQRLHDDGDWEYEGRRPFANLSDDTLLTLEEAMAFGKRTGRCCCCARELTNEESIELGIGPICRAKYF